MLTGALTILLTGVTLYKTFCELDRLMKRFSSIAIGGRTLVNALIWHCMLKQKLCGTLLGGTFYVLKSISIK